MRRAICVHCGYDIHWTGVEWLHTGSDRKNCAETTVADPGT